MPSKKKKKNPPVKSRASRQVRQDNYELVGKVVAGTLVSSLLVTIVFAVYAYQSADAVVPGKNILQFLPPIIGVGAGFIARPVKDFFHMSLSETWHAALISGLASVLVFGLILLIA